MNEPDIVLERIAKLLRLANSPNEHEAAIAASKAQELMFRYGITASQVESTASTKADTVKSQVVRDVFEGKVRTGWRAKLFSSVGRTSMCFPYTDIDIRTGDPYGIYIGVESDVQVAVYVFTYLKTTLERQAELYIRKNHLRGGAAISGRSSWLNGACDAVTKRLVDEFIKRKQEAGEIGTALVVSREGEISRYLQTHAMRFKTHRSRVRVTKSYVDGMRHGNEMDLGKPGLSYEEAVEKQRRDRYLP